jgi:teichuronic acid exporter
VAQSEIPVEHVHHRARRGIKLLVGRQFIIQCFTFLGSVALARVLSPSLFGLYAIATFLVQTFAMLGDFGLAPSFIQRKEELTDEDLQVGFTLQQIITTILVAILLLAAPWLVRLYPKVSPDTVWLIRALAFSLYLTSWRSISALQLERHLLYQKLAIVEIVEVVAMQATAVGLAFAGYGVWSFVWATLLRGVLGTVLIYAMAPWPIRLRFDKETAKSILRFGIPFQGAALLNNIGSWVTPTLVGGLIGPQAVGYLTWATSHGKKPLMLVENVMRVSFSHFSRIQDDQIEVERLMVRYLTYLLLPAGLWFSVLLAAGPALVDLVFTGKWLPAVPALILAALAVNLDVIIWVVSVTLNATGYVNMAAQRSLIRTVLQIVLGVAFVLLFGYNGVPLAYIITLVVTLPIMFKGLPPGTMRRVLGPVTWVIAPIIVSGLMGVAVSHLPGAPVLRAVLAVVIVILCYILTTLFICPAWFKQVLFAGKERFIKRRAARPI